MTSNLIKTSAFFVCALWSTTSLANDAAILSSAAGGDIVLTASGSRFAGAISSLTYRGVQYIDIADHGRQMQSAIQVNNWGECYNPNEAGSYNDGTASDSDSVLISLSSTGNILSSKTQPAYWLAVGQNTISGPVCNPNLPSPNNTVNVAQNPTNVSDFILERTSSFYGFGINNLIDVNVKWTVPRAFSSSNTEASTAYLPSDFNTFLTYDRASRTLTKVVATATDLASQHTTLPVIISKSNGLHAIGAFSPELITNPSHGYMAYFYFGSGNKPSSKWSCVFGEVNVPANSIYSYSCPIAVGTVDEVVSAIESYPVAGQSVSSMIPIFRFYKSSQHFMTTSYAEAASAGFAFETTGFHAFPAGGSGYTALYRCFNTSNSDHFISTAQNCEGKAQEGVIGYAATSQVSGTVPLYRFYRASTKDHLITTNYSEGTNGNYASEGLLGYVTY